MMWQEVTDLSKREQNKFFGTETFFYKTIHSDMLLAGSRQVRSVSAVCVCAYVILSPCVQPTLGNCRLMVKGDGTCRVVTLSTLSENPVWNHSDFSAQRIYSISDWWAGNEYISSAGAEVQKSIDIINEA